MEIRRFTEKDNIGDVSRVYALSWKAAYSEFIPRDYLRSIKENAWYEYLAGVLPSLWLASECGQIIGACTYGPARDEACRAWGETVSLYLLPRRRRERVRDKAAARGYGSLFEMGCGSVYLWVFEDNHTARRFYEKNGFFMEWGQNERNNWRQEALFIQICFQSVKNAARTKQQIDPNKTPLR